MTADYTGYELFEADLETYLVYSSQSIQVLER